MAWGGIPLQAKNPQLSLVSLHSGLLASYNIASSLPAVILGEFIAS
jgi:hypothetical protein